MIAIALATTAAATTWLSVSVALMSRCRRSLPVTEVPDLDALRAAAVRRAQAREAVVAAAAAAAADALPAPRTSPENEEFMPALPLGPVVPARARRVADSG